MVTPAGPPLKGSLKPKYQPEVFNEPVLTGEVQKFEQEIQPFLDCLGGHAENPPKIHHSFPNREFRV